MSRKIDSNTKLNIILDLDPKVVDYIVSLNPHDFERLHHPLMRRFMAPRITLGRVAVMTQHPVAELLQRIAEITDVDIAVTAPEDYPQSAQVRPEWVESATIDEQHTVNLLPIDETLDVDPMPPISRAIYRLEGDEVVLVKHKWEPQPLYDIWSKTDIEWYAEQQGSDEWWIWLRLGAQHKRRLISTSHED